MSEYLASGSYIVITMVLILSGMGLPVPEEVPIIAAGVLSAHGRLDPGLALVCCIAGALIGDTASYWIGYHFGRGILQRHRWWAHVVTPQRELQLERIIRAHGVKIFFTARFLIGIRSAIYLTAGILRISFLRFILIDALCAGVIITVFFGLSYWFGEQVGHWIRQGEWAVTILVVVGVLVAVLLAVWQYGKRAAAALDPLPFPQESSSGSEDLGVCVGEQFAANTSEANAANANPPPPDQENPPELKEPPRS